MTELDSHATRTTSSPHSHSLTIYRDTPLNYTGTHAARLPQPGIYTPAHLDEHASSWILLGFAALTFPTVVYSLTQMLNFVSAGSLEHAVRAFLP